MKDNEQLKKLSLWQRLVKLFTTTIYLSTVAFGGGLVIVPLLRKTYVEKYQWLLENELLDDVALAQSTPGAIITNTTMLIGFQTAGILGALTTLIASVIPPFLIITGVYYGYEAIKAFTLTDAIMSGMRAGVAAVILDVVLKMSKTRVKEDGWFGVVVMLLSFVATFFLKFSVIYSILIAAALGIALSYLKLFRDNKSKPQAVAAGEPYVVGKKPSDKAEEAEHVDLP